MSCCVTDMKVIRRDDVNFELTFADVDGNPIDITGATVFFTVKKKLTDSDPDAVIKKSITVFTDPTNGIATLSLTSTDTNINPGQYYFDIQLETSDGKVASSNAGKFMVAQDVTVRTVS